MIKGPPNGWLTALLPHVHMRSRGKVIGRVHLSSSWPQNATSRDVGVRAIIRCYQNVKNDKKTEFS